MKLAFVLAGFLSASVSALSGTGSSTTATPTCDQIRPATGAPAASITAALASASAVVQACDTTKQHLEKRGNLTTNYWSFGSYYLNISQAVAVGAQPQPLPVVQTCQDTFNNILSSCIKDGSAPVVLYDAG